MIRMAALRTLPILLPACLVLAAGCRPGRARETVVFATLANSLVTSSATDAAGAAATESALSLLSRTIDEINRSADIRFVVVLGNLIGDGRARSLDRARSALAELAKPYYVVLGAEGFGSPPPGAVGPGEAEARDTMPLGRSLATWTFRGHGFQGPEPYWHASVGGGLALVALDTAAPGPGKPGHVDAEQLRWLDTALAAHANESVVVLCYHALAPFHPFDTTAAWQDRLVDNRQEVAEVLDRHPNVLVVISASHMFAAGKVVGRVVHLTVPALSAWPLAYDVTRIAADRVERQYLMVGTDDEGRAAFDRLAARAAIRNLFGVGERAELAINQVFGGRKTESWNLSTMRP